MIIIVVSTNEFRTVELCYFSIHSVYYWYGTIRKGYNLGARPEPQLPLLISSMIDCRPSEVTVLFSRTSCLVTEYLIFRDTASVILGSW